MKSQFCTALGIILFALFHVSSCWHPHDIILDVEIKDDGRFLRLSNSTTVRPSVHTILDGTTESAVGEIGKNTSKQQSTSESRCQGDQEFHRFKETFLDYLLRLELCDKREHSIRRVTEACRKRTYNATEYYRISYLRFCEPQIYGLICSNYTVVKSSPNLFQHYRNEDIDEEYSGSGWSHLSFDVFIERFHEEDSHMVKQACVSIEKFSQALQSIIAKSSSSEINARLQDPISRNDLSFSTIAQNITPTENITFLTVNYTEWLNTLIPFCRLFTCGATYDQFASEPTTFYNCMPKRCRLTIIFSIVFDAILAILTIIANSLVLGVAARTKIMRNVPGYFKISLAIADLIVGFIVLPACIFTTYTIYMAPLPFRYPIWIPRTTDYMNRSLANFMGFFLVLSFAASINTMAVASLDRYLAITKPFKYRQGCYLTKRRCIIAFAGIWLYGCLLAIYPVFTAEPYGLTAFNLILSIGFTSSLVYAVGLSIPLLAVWFLNGAMLSQVCADGEKRRSIRATGVLSSQGSTKRDSTSQPSSTGEKLTTTETDSNMNEAAPPQIENSINNDSAVPNTKTVVSRNISSSSISYYRNDKTNSNLGSSVIERMKWSRKGTAIFFRSQHNQRYPSNSNTPANVERRLARTLAIMIGAFTFALLPSIVILIVFASLTPDNVLGSSEPTYIASAFYISSRILLSNSFWNCIIYSIRNRHFRRAMFAIFLCKKEKIDQRLRYSITQSQCKRKSARMSSTGSEKQALSKCNSLSSNGTGYQYQEHRRSTMMWSLSSSSPCPSRKSSTDASKTAVSRSTSNNVECVASNISREIVTRSVSAPISPMYYNKIVIPAVTIEIDEETNEITH